MGMQTGHKALCQIICDHLCQGTTYTGIDGQDYLSSLQMQKDKKYSTDIELMAAAHGVTYPRSIEKGVTSAIYTTHSIPMAS